MNIEYISHSCIFIDTGDAKVVMDPWFNGSAYCNQWHLFPKPLNMDRLKTVDCIMVSHGHEDHLHPNSLSLLPKTARVYYPYLWKAGIEEFMNELGFTEVNEAVSYKSYRISESTKITFLTTSMDTIMILESKGKVLVNLNDALNSHHENVVKRFIDAINKRWKKIDYLFVGLGGAGYFPNMVHHPLKNDFEVGLLREQKFVHNWCRLVHDLNPLQVLPFAPGFVLLQKETKWINELKFPREKLYDYYKEHYDANPKFEMLVMYPHDEFNDGVLYKKSPYQAQLVDDSLNHLIDTMYAEEMIEADKPEFVDESMGDVIFAKLRKHIPHAARVFTEDILEKVNFAIRLEDIKINNYFIINYKNKKWNIYRSDKIAEGNNLLLRTKSRFINFSIDNEWGGDVFIGGYALDMDVLDDIAMKENLDMACVRLLTSYPIGSETMIKQPARAAKYLYNNPVLARIMFEGRFLAPKILNKIDYNERDRWVNKSKCEICQICNMPMLSYDLGERLGA
jgi:hypothetical protein